MDDIAPGYEKLGNAGNAPNFWTYSLRFNVSASTPIGTEIPFIMNISDEAGNIPGRIHSMFQSFDFSILGSLLMFPVSMMNSNFS